VGEAGQGGRRDFEGLRLQETIGECYSSTTWILMNGYVAGTNYGRSCTLKYSTIYSLSRSDK
jgi:hypothetical protein